MSIDTRDPSPKIDDKLTAHVGMTPENEPDDDPTAEPAEFAMAEPSPSEHPDVVPPVANGAAPKVARNIMTTLLTQALMWCMTFVVVLYLPRYLGPRGMGELSTGLSISAIVGVISALGASQVLINQIARDHSRTGELLTSAIAMRWLVAISVGAVTLVVMHFLTTPLQLQIIAIGILGVSLATMNDSLNSALVGQEKVGRQNIAQFVEKASYSVVVIALVILKAPIQAIAAAMLVSTLVSMGSNIYSLRFLRGQLRWPSRKSMMYMFTAGLPFFGWNVCQRLYGQTNTIFLYYIAGAASAGFYSVGFRLIQTSMAFPTALITAVQPTLSRLYKESEAEYKSLSRRLMAIALMCGIPISTILTLMPARIMALLPYGHKFDKSIQVLQIGGFGVVIWFAAMVLGTMIITRDGQKFMLRSSILATVVGVPLQIVLAIAGQRFWANAAAGSMLSNVIVEIFLIGCYLWVLPRDSFTIDTVKQIGKFILATLPMGGCLLLARPLHLGGWVALPCILIYVLMCWLLGCISPRDLMLARQALQRKAARAKV